MDEEQDEATVVIDFNSIKDELNKDELLTDEESDLLFDVDLTLDKKKVQKNIYLFDYESNYFADKIEEHSLDKPYNHLTDVKGLNKVLSKDPESIICFYYNDSPKVVNQLSAQIKVKFKNTKTLIIAKGLSPKKAEQHHKSKYGANSYLREPFELKQFLDTLGKL